MNQNNHNNHNNHNNINGNHRISSEWNFLEKVVEILKEECVFPTESDSKTISEENKIVDFVEPEKLKKCFDFTLPLKCNPLDEFQLEEICRQVAKLSVKTNHPFFRNQLYGQIDPIGLAGSWMSEALNTSAYTFEVAPVFTLMEMEIIKTISSLCGYEDGDGIFSPGGSISNMYAVILARFKLNPEIKTKGIFGLPPFVIFTSEESHYSFKKIAHWLGIGTDNHITVRTNDKGQMLVSDLEEKILQSKSDGKVPLFVNATAATTVLGAFDNIDDIANVCEKYKLWLHVDACLGGAALLSNNIKYRSLLKGIHRTNSIAWNPHKSLGAPLQCSLLLVNEKNLLARCNSTTDARYLFQQDKFYDVRYDTGNKSVQCGRKIDSLKIWLMFKAKGLEYYGKCIDDAIDTAQLFCEKVKNRTGFSLVQNQFEYTNVCFWYIPKNMRNLEKNQEWYDNLYKVAPSIKEKMVRKGSLMVGYSPLSSRNIGNFFRMAFTIFPKFNEQDLDLMLDEIELLGEEI